MQLTINRRLLRNNCLFFFGAIFLLEFFQITFLRHEEKLPSTILTAPLQQKASPISVRIFDYLRPHYYPVSCQNLYESDPDELKHALAILADTPNLPLIPDRSYNISKEHCSTYRSERFNENFHKEDTNTNQQFPLAFTILMYENVEQFERLLRVIYRPQNFYCVHVDNDVSIDILQSVRSIAQCFDNVILASKQEKVVYATFSRLQADLNCMQDLMKFSSWKYLLNVANTELPLKTNNELVKILSIYRGYNDIEGRWKSRNLERTEYVWQVINTDSKSSQGSFIRRTNEKKKAPPGNMEIVKGSAYGAFSRAFIEFVQTSPIAKELLDWSRDTYSPDEHYWATLNYNTHLKTPGGYKAKSDPVNWTARFVNWGESNCYGRIIHGICVFGTVDLPTLLNRHELFANKFRLNADPIAYQCLEELMINRSRSSVPLNDATFYRQMPFLLPT